MSIIKGPILGQEAVTHYGLGRVTEIFLDTNIIGVTPYVADYQMNFDKKNVSLVSIKVEKIGD